MTIVFDNKQILLLYLYPLSTNYNFKEVSNVDQEIIKSNGDNTLPLVIFKDIDKNLELVYLPLPCISSGGLEINCDIFVTDSYSLKVNVDNSTKLVLDYVLFEVSNDKMKLIIIDLQGEVINGSHLCSNNFLYFKKFINELTSKENVYYISQRELLHPVENKIVTNLKYLPLLFYYFYLSDNLFLQPEIPNIPIISSKSTEYDFISYMGKYDRTSFNGTSRYEGYDGVREKLIKLIDFKDKKILLPNITTMLRPIQKMAALNLVDEVYGRYGSYNWFSEMECRQAKVKIIFETLDPFDNEQDDQFNFLTEKTLKAFLSSQPYILIIKSSQKKYLRKFGFKFPEPDNYLESIDYISDLCNIDINEWVDTHSDKFKHNKDLMYKTIYNSELPHIQLLENIVMGASHKINTQNKKLI